MKWLEKSLSTSRNVEARAVAWIAEAVLAVEGSAPDVPDVHVNVGRVLEAGHHDAIVMGCRAEPKLAKRIAESDVGSASLRAILIRSNDEVLARSAGLHVPKSPKRAGMLSPRELEVYELMIQGRTNREIGKRLFITESTTKVHVRHILEKLGVRSRVEAVRAWRPDNESGFGDAG